MIPLIDAHLDLAWNALSFDRDLRGSAAEINSREKHFSDSQARGHATVGLTDMRQGGVSVCLGTVLARARRSALPSTGPLRICLDHGSADSAHAMARGQLTYYDLLESNGLLARIRTSQQLSAHWQRWLSDPDSTPLGLILAMEGADPIVEPAQAELWYELGLRAVNLVHYGQNRYAVGTGDSGPLTTDGRTLLQECERLGILLDVTHLSEPSFFEAVDLYGGALHASHNNCRSLVPGDRQFSDEQIELLIQRNAVIGVALDNWMLTPDWHTGSTSRDRVTLESVADHLDHICQLAGSHQHAAIGSDLDGGYGTEQSPSGVETIADLQKLTAILERRGYGTEAINAIFHQNWLNFFLQHLPCDE